VQQTNEPLYNEELNKKIGKPIRYALKEGAHYMANKLPSGLDTVAHHVINYGANWTEGKI